jgi:hypothetical protein
MMAEIGKVEKLEDLIEILGNVSLNLDFPSRLSRALSRS